MSDEILGRAESFDVRNPTIRSRGAIKPLTIVSADSHVAPPAEEYIRYLDPKYRVHGAEYLKFIEETYYGLFSIFGYPFGPEVLDKIDTRGAIRSGGELGSYDPGRRLRETEAEGVVAEFLHPTGPLSLVPFFSSGYPLVSPELRAAGARAHNRFLKEFCQIAPERLLGVRLIYPWPDMNAAVADCGHAADAGAKAVFPPQQAGVPGDVCPALYDRCYDPFWAACQDLGLAVHIHAGWGHPQGLLEVNLRVAREAVERGELSVLAEILDTFSERRALWQLMWGGVFDRFPRLRISFVEVHCDWVPPTLEYLDGLRRSHPGGMKLTPTEYWHRHCAVGASIARYTDIAARHQIGIDRFMFGTDYPHVESTWPNTWKWIRGMLGDLPEPELRKVLGDNAIEFYGLDRRTLEAAALRCGPLREDIVGTVDPDLLDHFDMTTGIRKPVDMHGQVFTQAVAEDLSNATALNAL